MGGGIRIPRSTPTPDPGQVELGHDLNIERGEFISGRHDLVTGHPLISKRSPSVELAMVCLLFPPL